jgi:3-oxoacyl-[acyl-carrier-protein] synthase III
VCPTRGTAVIFGDGAGAAVVRPSASGAGSNEIPDYGNTSSASIPLALEEAIRKGRVKSGDHVLLAGFGSGLTWGACLL